MNTVNNGYCITGSAWECSSDESRKEFSLLLKTDVVNASYFCRLYLEKFILIHEIAHVVQVESKRTLLRESEKEYEANLFALKYFEYKNETTFIKELFKWVDDVFERSGTKILYHAESFDDLLVRYKFDRKAYGLLQFTLLSEVRNSKEDFESVVRRISGGKIREIDGVAKKKKGLKGESLIRECMRIVFGMSNYSPKVELCYYPRLGFQTIEEIF